MAACCHLLYSLSAHCALCYLPSVSREYPVAPSTLTSYSISAICGPTAYSNTSSLPREQRYTWSSRFFQGIQRRSVLTSNWSPPLVWNERERKRQSF